MNSHSPLARWRHALAIVFLALGAAACGGGGGAAPVVAPLPEPAADSNASSFGSIAYGNKTYVSIFQNSFSTSVDGRTWSAPIPGVNWKFSTIIWDKTQFVAVGEKGMTATSKDGLQWTLRKANTDYDLLCVERVNDALIATGLRPLSVTETSRDSVTLTSRDGVSWIVQRPNITVLKFAYWGGRLIALNNNSFPIYSSLDGVNWIPGGQPPASDMPAGASHRDFTEIAYGDGRFVAIAQFRDVWAGMVGYALYSSTNGVDWTVRYNVLSINPYSMLNAVTYAGNQFVAVGSDGIILTSADGLTWAERNSGTKNHLYTVIYARGLLIAGGSAGTILTSADGINWANRITDVTNALFEIRYTGTAFYALMSGEAPYYSSSYNADYGYNPYRTTANLISLDGVRWFGGPAAAGFRFDSKDDAGITPPPAFPSEPVALPDSGPIAVDTNGNIFVGDQSRDIIIKVLPNSSAVPFAGRSGIPGVRDGREDEAEFTNPAALATDAAGNVYVADGLYKTASPMNILLWRAAIRKITPDGTVSTLAGSPSAGDQSNVGSADGIGTDARFTALSGLAVDMAGNLYASDSITQTIRKIDTTKVVTTFAGQANSIGYLDGVGSNAQFSSLRWIQSDASGNLYAASASSPPIQNTIRKITSDAVVSTIAAVTPKAEAMTIDRATGTLYISDDTRVFKLTQSRVLTDTGIAVSGKSALAFMAPNKLVIFSDGTIRIVPLLN